MDAHAHRTAACARTRALVSAEHARPFGLLPPHCSPLPPRAAQITGADEAAALGVLEATGFNLEAAVNLHFAAGETCSPSARCCGCWCVCVRGLQTGSRRAPALCRGRVLLGLKGEGGRQRGRQPGWKNGGRKASGTRESPMIAPPPLHAPSHALPTTPRLPPHCHAGGAAGGDDASGLAPMMEDDESLARRLHA